MQNMQAVSVQRLQTFRTDRVVHLEDGKIAMHGRTVVTTQNTRKTGHE